ncbi:hypothetical protein, partial [Bifidobacterium longum]|uniref:hypothetical protein n=1 Tax=Bifidobacterium longum TaxID=216816 RepID=UPI00298F72DD
QTGNQPEEGTRHAERQQVNNLHATTPQRKSGMKRHARIVATTAFYRRVEISLNHAVTIRIRRLFMGSRNEIRCSPACRNNSFHVQLPSVRSRGQLTRNYGRAKLAPLWLDYRLAFV